LHHIARTDDGDNFPICCFAGGVNDDLSAGKLQGHWPAGRCEPQNNLWVLFLGKIFIIDADKHHARSKDSFWLARAVVPLGGSSLTSNAWEILDTTGVFAFFAGQAKPEWTLFIKLHLDMMHQICYAQI
jgi:hypothetical protein